MKRLSTRTKAELVATFMVAYLLLLVTAGDLERWAGAPALDARACPGSTLHIACRLTDASGRRRARSRHRQAPAHRLSGGPVVVAVRGFGQAPGGAYAVGRGLVALDHPVSRASRVEVATLRRASRHVVADVASLRGHTRARHRRAARRAKRG